MQSYQKRSAEYRRCPECGRGAALQSIDIYLDGADKVFVRVCRFCRAERVTGPGRHKWIAEQ